MTEQNLLAIGSTAQDLKRVATFIARGSLDNAERFLNEAKKHAKQTDTRYVLPYLKSRLNSIESLNLSGDLNQTAEKALTTGVILQNAFVVATR